MILVLGYWMALVLKSAFFLLAWFQVRLEHPIAIGPIGINHFLGWSIQLHAAIRYQIHPPKNRVPWHLRAWGSFLEVWRYQRCILGGSSQWLRTIGDRFWRQDLGLVALDPFHAWPKFMAEKIGGDPNYWVILGGSSVGFKAVLDGVRSLLRFATAS